MKAKWGQGELTFKQWHHAYLGLIIIILGYILHHEWIRVIGWVIFSDDILQHTVQYFYDLLYQSPLKYLYGKWLYPTLHGLLPRVF